MRWFALTLTREKQGTAQVRLSLNESAAGLASTPGRGVANAKDNHTYCQHDRGVASPRFRADHDTHSSTTVVEHARYSRRKPPPPVRYPCPHSFFVYPYVIELVGSAITPDTRNQATAKSRRKHRRCTDRPARSSREGQRIPNSFSGGGRSASPGNYRACLRDPPKSFRLEVRRSHYERVRSGDQSILPASTMSTTDGDAQLPANGLELPHSTSFRRPARRSAGGRLGQLTHLLCRAS